MAISTLVIGVGGTGVLTVRALKHLYFQVEQAERAPARFLAIDFDRSALGTVDGGHLAELEDREFLYLNPEDIQVPVRNIDRTFDKRPAWEKVRQWFPDPNEIRIPTSDVEANGAGQFRMLGRLGFFVYGNLIEKTLLRAYESLDIEVDTGSASRDRRIILVASLAGGTGSGMMIDLAYIVRRHLESRPHVFGYLLLPEVFAEVDQGGRIYQNTYASLRELAHLKDQQIPFEADYFDIAPIEVSTGGEHPFSRIFLFGRATVVDEKPVNAATRQMARTILAQLNRTIQEKALAVAANTAASDLAAERRRLRTHCFSTAGSCAVALGESHRVDEDRLFDAALGMMPSDQLPELYAELGLRGLEKAREQIAKKRPGPIPTGDASVHLNHEPKAKNLDEQLIADWRESLDGLVRSHADRLLDGLKKRVTNLRRGESVEGGHIPGSPEEHANRLCDLLSKDLDAKSAAQRLSELKNLGVKGFVEAENAVVQWVADFIGDSESSTRKRQVLRQKAFFGQLRKILPKLEIAYTTGPAPPEITTLRETLGDLDHCRSHDIALPGWYRVASENEIQNHYAIVQVGLAEKALDLPYIRQKLATILRVRALTEMHNRLDAAVERVDQELRTFDRRLRLLQRQEDLLAEPQSLTEQTERQLRELLKARLPDFLEAVDATDLDEEMSAEKQRPILKAIFVEAVLRDSELASRRFDENKDQLQKKILEALVQVRQNLFVRRTPNPQRKGFAIVLCPEGIEWGDGSVESYLEVNTEQLLLCRCDVLRTRGAWSDRIWIYYEDLFNPPEHLRNLDDYYTSYRSQAHPELFHIDRRFLEQKEFRQIVTGTSTFVIQCGNPGCDYNIARVPIGQLACPGCGQWIRSRCGNLGCQEDALHRKDGKNEARCPSCGGFNQAAWWKCQRHGKDEVLVPSDKPRCPRCIERHHNDPLGFPERCISQRPDLRESIQCPRCVALHLKDPAHPVFEIRGDLLTFYRDGVNGHHLEAFRKDAGTKYGLPEGFRCPSCRTHLIPVHHRSQTGEACP